MYKKIMDFIYVVLMIFLYIYGLIFFWKRKRVVLNPQVFKYNKPLLLISNHVRMIDPFMIANTLPFVFMVKHCPFIVLAKPPSKFVNMNKVQKFFSNWAYIIYFLFQCAVLPTKGTPEEKLEVIQKEIDKGYTTLVFPEGKLSIDGKLGEIKKGISILRKNNPTLPFLFVAVKYKKIKWTPFYKSFLVVGDISFEQPENYQEFVKNNIQNLLNAVN